MKKRFLAAILALCMMVGMLPPGTAWAADAPTSGTCGEDVTWSLSGGTLTISGTGPMQDFSGAFDPPWYPQTNSITSVVISSGVTSIGNFAFGGCTSLTNINIPSNITRIGVFAFNGCMGLTNVTIPNSVKRIEGGAFQCCTGLTNVNIPNSVTSMGYGLFNLCNSLTSITLPSSITRIADSVFSGCTALTDVTIPNSVTSIGGSAFANCTSLTNMTIPNSVTVIGGSAFSGCTGLTSIVIPNSVTKVGDSAFKHCTNLTGVTIPSSVTIIGVGAFSSGTGLNIYYDGTEKQWNAIKNEYGNPYQINATIHYNSTGPDNPDNPDTPEIQLTGELPSVFTGDLDVAALSFAVTCGKSDTSGTVSWTSSNENVFRLTGNHTRRPYSGLRTVFEVRGDALSAGTSVITVTANDGTSTEFTVEVKEKSPSQIEMSGNHTVCVGESETLSTRITFGDIPGSNPTVTWTSSDSDIIALSSSGAGRISRSVAATSGPVSFDLPLYGRSIGTAAIVCSLSTGERETFVVAVSAGGIDFDLNIYRADKLLDPALQIGSGTNDVLRAQTPCDIFAASLRESGFSTGANAWTALTTAIEAADKPSSLYDFAVKQKDVYSAIILSMLEASSEADIADTYKDTYTDAKDFLSQMKSAIELKYDTDFDAFANLAEMPDYMRSDVKESFSEYYKRRYPELNELDTLFTSLDTLFNTVEKVENIAEKFNTVIVMTKFSDSLKTVIRTMEQRCPESNAALKLALADCVDIIDKSVQENITKINLGEWAAVGVDLSKFFVDEFWKDVKGVLNAGFPGLNIILTAYKASKYFTNNLFDIDSLTEQYYKMLATLDIENLVDDVNQVLEKSYVQNINTEKAAAYLSTVDVQFAARDQDCIAAYDFIDKLENAAVNKIARAMGLSSYSRNELKKKIDSLQRNYTTAYTTALFGWINYVETDYPGAGLEEKYWPLFEEAVDKIAKKKYVIACPVDVYVYDRQGSRVASVVNNRPYCDGNLVVVVDGDVKTLYFYDDSAYRMEYVGSGSGTMDVTVTEYDQKETALRDVYFYGVPVTGDRKYEMDTDGRTLGDVTYRLTSQGAGTTEPDLDTYRPERAKHTVRIVSGSMVKQDELLFETDAYPDEQIDIYAYIPENAKFIGWTSDAGTGIFEDAKSSVTKIRVPNSDVTLTAVLQKSSVQPGDLTGDGKVTMADVIRLARGAAGYVTLTEQEQTAGDVTGDGKITMADVIRVARYAAGYSTTL